jgi:hypothetical protein
MAFISVFFVFGCYPASPPHSDQESETPQSESSPSSPGTAATTPTDWETTQPVTWANEEAFRNLDVAYPFSYPDQSTSPPPDPERIPVYLAIRERLLSELRCLVGVQMPPTNAPAQPYFAALSDLGMGPSEFTWLTKRLYDPWNPLRLTDRRSLHDRIARLRDPALDAVVFRAQMGGRRDGPADSLARWAYWNKTPDMRDCGSEADGDRRVLLRCIQESIRDGEQFLALWRDRGIDSAIGGAVMKRGERVAIVSYDSLGCGTFLEEFCGVHETRCQHPTAKASSHGGFQVTCEASTWAHEVP